ncbi:MAG: RNA polymerase sigma factor [Fuerstiella sp.]|nr:RNA polymerase sigma factor [Fuerstiella sp.]MCP4856332.1 RNA polymerase sigma factor [Fuerstiella sp.]
MHPVFSVLSIGASLLPHDAEIRRLVEQACVEFERDLRAFLLGVLRDPHLVDDVFQKTVIKAIEASSAVNPETIRGWLFQIALNEARESQRRMSRQGRLQRAVWESFSSGAELDTEDGLSHIMSVEEDEAIRIALARLDGNYREVVMRRVQKGQTFAVIASEMNKPLGTVLTWMRRALIELREMNELRRLSDD